MNRTSEPSAMEDSLTPRSSLIARSFLSWSLSEVVKLSGRVAEVIRSVARRGSLSVKSLFPAMRIKPGDGSFVFTDPFPVLVKVGTVLGGDGVGVGGGVHERFHSGQRPQDRRGPADEQTSGGDLIVQFRVQRVAQTPRHSQQIYLGPACSRGGRDLRGCH